MDKERIGLVGPGRMGLPMLRHLLKHGYDVTVADVSADALRRAEAEGATSVAAVRDLGEVARFVIVAVGFDDEARSVTAELLQTLQPGSVIAVSSTVAPKTVQELDQRARLQGVSILDVPICRGGWAADEGTLLALMGGTADVVERARPIYASFASDIMHVGDVGHGQVAKTMNNMLLWVNGVALIEAAKLAESTGIHLPRLREALLISSGKSAALEDWDMMTFTWALKDMQIVSAMADEAGLSLPIAGAVKELVKDARRIKRSNPPNWTGRQD